jgi:protein-S-isoprenylcysteine O-methyltransferase Ste14
MIETAGNPCPASDIASGPVSPDHPVVVARPPLVYLCSILIGSTLELAWPLEVFPRALEAPLGVPLILIALVLFALSVRELRAAGTAIRTHRAVTSIVRSGPYRLSRNPIYLSFTLLHLGIGIWVNGAWLLGSLALTLTLMSYGVIAREERYLARKFGAEYLNYRASVRRWL